MFWGLIVSIVIIGCRKNNEISWTADYLLPLAKTNISLQNIFGDYLQNTGNNTLEFVYNKELYNNSPALIAIPDTGIATSFTLNSLKLEIETSTGTLL